MVKKVIDQETKKENEKMIKSWNSLDFDVCNDGLKNEYLKMTEYAGVNLTEIEEPAVLLLGSEPICILDMAEQRRHAEFIRHIFPKPAEKYEIHACPYCWAHDNPCSIVVAPPGMSEDEPCVGCRVMIEDMIEEVNFQKPNGCETPEECFDQVLEDILQNPGPFNWNRYFEEEI